MTYTSRRDTSCPRGTVHVSTACILAVFTFCAGLFAGSLYTSLHAAPATVQSAAPDTTSQSGGHSQGWLEHVRQAQAAVEENPADADGWTHLGNLYFDEHHFADAVKAYEKSLSLRPGDANVLTDLGTMYRELGQPEEALQRFKAALVADKNHRNARFNLGLTLAVDLGHTAEGLAAWKELARLYPGLKVGNGIAIEKALAPLATDSGSLLESRNKNTEALLAYTLALMEDPDFLPARERKAALLEKLGRADEAEDLRRQAASRHPASPDAGQKR